MQIFQLALSPWCIKGLNLSGRCINICFWKLHQHMHQHIFLKAGRCWSGTYRSACWSALSMVLAKVPINYESNKFVPTLDKKCLYWYYTLYTLWVGISSNYHQVFWVSLGTVQIDEITRIQIAKLQMSHQHEPAGWGSVGAKWGSVGAKWTCSYQRHSWPTAV